MSARLDGTETSVVVDVSFGAMGAQEFAVPRAANSPVETKRVRIFFTIA